MPAPAPWPVIAAARATDPGARVPLRLLHGQRLVEVGDVARRLLPDLRRWPTHLEVRDDGVDLLADAPLRQRVLGDIHEVLRADGLIRGWRGEAFSLFGPDGHEVLAAVERATARFWGLLTRGAHANGYVPGPDGRPTHLWIARRSATKATDPGLLDNLVGGGVGHGQTPWQTLQREGWEEAGLPASVMATARPAGVLVLHRDVPEGRQHEHLHMFDLALTPDTVPVNLDGEVDELHCWPVARALGAARDGAMTVDAALVTLDFGLRHGLLPWPEAQVQAAALSCCRPARPSGDAGIQID